MRTRGSALNSVWFPSLVIFASASIWGLYWIPLRRLEAYGLTGLWAVFAFNMLPLIFLLPVVFKRHHYYRKDARHILFIGFAVGAALVCYAIGLYYSTVMRATLMYYLTPVWSTLLAMMILKERVDTLRWLAVVCGFLGVMMMLSAGEDSAKPLNVGDLAGLLSGILWGFGAVWIRRHPDISTLETVPCQFFFGSAVVLVFILLFDTGVPTPRVEHWIEALPLLLLFNLLLLPSLFAILWGAQRVSPGRVGILMMSEVLVAGITAAWLAGEYMSVFEWIGAVLIIGAALLEVGAGDAAPATETDP